MRAISFELCDVFTDRALAGGPVAVFTDAGDLDGKIMAALAREVNLPRSAFVLPATLPEATAAIRVFTPTKELPVPGHAALATAFVLAAPLQSEVLRLQTSTAVVTARMARGAHTGFGWMTQPLPRIAPYAATLDLFSALGVAVNSGSGLPVELYDELHEGAPRYVFVEMASPQAVAMLRPNFVASAAALDDTTFVTFAKNADSWKSRVFSPGEGAPELSADGGAAALLAVHLARHGRTTFGETTIIEQGRDIGRLSTLHARTAGDAQHLELVEVGGSCVAVARGEFNIP